MKTKTDRIFNDAYEFARPEHGEGWDHFADILEAEMGKMEKLLRQVLPDYADEVEESERHKVVAEITGKDVIDIRDFLNS
jgi:hypothetical protein